jgi:hypothetical protein
MLLRLQMSEGGIEPRAIEALGWSFNSAAYAGVETPASLRFVLIASRPVLEEQKRIPVGNYRQKQGKGKSGSFAALRMTTLFLLTLVDQARSLYLVSARW